MSSHWLAIVTLLSNAWATWLTAQEAAAQPDTKQAAEPRLASPLPITRIVLFSSGVGYFQREGPVQGNASVELRFKTDQINDLIKSLVVQDADGGQVVSVSYGSRDPVGRALQSFAVDLTSNPSLGELLNQVRGERIEIMAPNATTGIIIGTEKQRQPIKGDQFIEIEMLNLLTDAGFRTVPLGQIQRLHLQDAKLDSELRQALDVLARSHDRQKKPVVLSFAGQGRRTVRVGYVVESPIWKTSYRLVLDEREKPFLQGWAIVENTTDDDWQNVGLTLVSGRPISFIMDLYEPLYATRPTVVPELFAGLSPKVYEGSLEKSEMAVVAAEKESDELAAGAQRRGLGAGLGGAMGGGALPNRARSPRTEMAPTPAAPEASARLDPSASVTSVAQAAEVGQMFQYAIKTPVSLSRQRSALLPIVNQAVEATKVSIYNHSVHAKHPLHGLRLRNSTNLHLMQGPLTVFASGAYAGDARIPDLQPGEERLLSYAMDLQIEVEPLAKDVPEELVSVRLAKGTLMATRKLRKEKSYNIKNRGNELRTVIVEHPFPVDWKLTAPAKPDERSRNTYRFVVKSAPQKLERLIVQEENQVSQSVSMTDANIDAILLYQRSRASSERVKQALQQIVQMKQQLADIARRRAQHEQRIVEIAQEQTRIRENMSRLDRNSELYSRYVKKFDDQETEIEQLRIEIAAVRKEIETKQHELDSFLLAQIID